MSLSAEITEPFPTDELPAHARAAATVTVDITGERLVVTGEIDHDNSATVRALIDEVAPSDRLSIDLSGVDFIDLSGLRALCEAAGGRRRCEVVRPSPSVSRLFELARFDWPPAH